LLCSPLSHPPSLFTRTEVTPEEKAAELVAAFPETSFASKTGLVLTGAGLMAAGISQEFFVSI
jgi:hypothetical protein